MLNLRLTLLLIVVAALGSLSVAPEEMPRWFPGAALLMLLAVVCVVFKVSGDWLKRQR